jgi:HK97 family phage prohead protease
METKWISNLEIKAAPEEDGGVIIEGYANAAVVDDVGDLMTFDKVDMRRYDKNPILLYNHNRDLPLGKVLERKLSEKGLWVKGRVSNSADPFISYIRDLVKEGILKTMSIGFEPKKEEMDSKGVNVIKEWRLNEISIVTLPANIDAEFSVAAKSLADKNGVSYADFVEGRCVAKAEGEEPKEPESTEPASEEPKAGCGDEENKPKAEEGGVQECISSKIPKLIEEGRSREQAIAIAVSMCSAEGKCGVENLSAEQWADIEKLATPPAPPAPPAEPTEENKPEDKKSMEAMDNFAYGPMLDIMKAQLAMTGEMVNSLKSITLLLAKDEDSEDNEEVPPATEPPPSEGNPEDAEAMKRASELSAKIKALAAKLGV